jgi:2-isopropylmalate synthase
MDEDLEALVTEGVPQVRRGLQAGIPARHLRHHGPAHGQRQLSVNGRSVKGAGYGNGPIDSAFNTIAKLTGTQAELLRFTVSALTGGTDAQGEVTVRLRENGLVALGRGSDPDIITASAKAYINGLNRLEYLKANPVKAGM